MALPATGPEREALRDKGQFWTPDWVAEAMVSYAIAGGVSTLFDPAVGAGAFTRALLACTCDTNRSVAFEGREVDPNVLDEAEQSGLRRADLRGVLLRDFLFDPSIPPQAAIVANPPYIRHHRLDKELKQKLKGLAERIVGERLDGRTGYHVYFLIRALDLLEEGGRLAFIVPSDVCEGKFASKLWKWISNNYRVDGAVTFAPEASPFPGVDTNPIILLLRNASPAPTLMWGRCLVSGTDALKTWLANDLQHGPNGEMEFECRELEEALRTGLSRPPSDLDPNTPTLADYASTCRGIATGANDFFLFTREEAAELAISSEYFLRCEGRTRDVPGDQVTDATLTALEEKSRPTFLLSIGDESKEELPRSLQDHIEEGEEDGIADRALISMRNPWYKMEQRDPPPLLFAYLGRRNARFIRNRVGVVPLTGFLCVYPHDPSPEHSDRLWAALNHPDTISNLALVAKSYGGGAVKAEPRSLEKLPIPFHVIEECGLEPPTLDQRKISIKRVDAKTYLMQSELFVIREEEPENHAV